MDSTTITILLAAVAGISGAVGAVAGAVAKWAIDHKRMEVQEEKQQGDQAIQVYGSLVAHQQLQIDGLVKDVRRLADQEMECRKLNLEMRVEIAALQTKVSNLERELGERSNSDA